MRGLVQTAHPQTGRYPLVVTKGSAQARGVAYGRQAKTRIAYSLRNYERLFRHYADVDWVTACRFAAGYGPVIEDYDASLVEEMQGIAEGAGCSYDDILTMNVRTEVMYGLGELRAAADCTAFAALPDATVDGHTIIGQNWDWHPSAFDSCVILASQPDDRPAFVTVVEAGLLAKMGMNDAGIGVATNAMVSDIDTGEPGIPYHVLLRALLTSTSFADAVSQVESVHRASSANYLIASKDGSAVDLEVAPGDRDHVFPIHPDLGVIGHANCYVAPSVTVGDQTAELRPLGRIRQSAIDRHLQALAPDISLQSIQSALCDHTDHPNSLCRHPLSQLDFMDRSATVASVIMDLDLQTMWVAEGQPCCHPYRQVAMAEVSAAFAA